jgi:hypothetical protein
MPSEAQVAAAFKWFDKDGNGTISLIEFKAALCKPTKVGTQFSEKDAEVLLAELDLNGDGVLDYAEFMRGNLFNHLANEDITHKHSPEAARDPVAAFAGRPTREGIFFIVEATLLPKLEYEQRIDVVAEFLSLHPNSCEEAKGFVMIRMNSQQIKELLRMSSYNWQGIQGVGKINPKFGTPGEWTIPQNFGWFLVYLRENKLVGWMDFLANL